MKKITKDMTIGEVLSINKNAKTILSGFGMHCFTCPFSQMETLEQAAMVHGVSIDLMIENLQAQLDEMRKEIKNAKSNSTNDDEPIKNAKSSSISTSKPTNKK